MPIIPLYDGKALVHISRPYVTWALLAANIIAFLATHVSNDAAQASLISFGLIPALFNHIVDLPPGYIELPGNLTLLSYSFLHADVWHLVGNMVFLWVFADNVEDSTGHVRFLLFYCLCVIGAGYAYVLSDPASQMPVIGASGAVAGVVAAYFILHPFQKIWVLVFGRIPLRLSALWVLGAWILFQVYSLAVAPPDDRVAWWSHIGGLVTGAGLIVILRRREVRLFDRGVQVLALTPTREQS